MFVVISLTILTLIMLERSYQYDIKEIRRKARLERLLVEQEEKYNFLMRR